MKGKTIATQIITTMILLIAAFGIQLGGQAASWLGIVSMVLSLVLSTFFASGTMTKQWTVVMWATNISGILIQFLNATGDQGLIAANVTNGIVIVINIVLQVYFSDKVLTNTKI
jgi:uncharacterized membrane protein YphA (DoxX/SURF4 family)